MPRCIGGRGRALTWGDCIDLGRDRPCPGKKGNFPKDREHTPADPTKAWWGGPEEEEVHGMEEGETT